VGFRDTRLAVGFRLVDRFNGSNGTCCAIDGSELQALTEIPSREELDPVLVLPPLDGIHDGGELVVADFAYTAQSDRLPERDEVKSMPSDGPLASSYRVGSWSSAAGQRCGKRKGPCLRV
jgi:hypothetical protein